MSLPIDLDVRHLRETLQVEGQVSFQVGAKRVFIFLNHDPQGVVIAWEGQGCYFYDGARPLNRFMLVAAGFDGIVAPTLVEIVNGIIDAGRGQQAAAIPQRLLPAQGQYALSGQETNDE